MALMAGCGEATSTGGSAGPEVRLREGGTAAFERELSRLRGRPIVVNQWASWCPACRDEFPLLQRLSRKYRGLVGFLGVSSQDVRDEAEQFLREYHTSFPHFWDPEAAVARSFRGGLAWPTTAFYTASGELNYTRQGAYSSQANLEADIRRYALRG
jgi:thiol-disulfide isomerase/thioredoxin